MELLEKERIDDLQYKGLKIIQKEDEFCFGIDSVLLSNFAKNIKKNSEIIDLGTGTGIISILLSKKLQAKKIYGIEIQKQVADMAKRSVELNSLENLVTILNEDLKKLPEILNKNYYDAIVTNPPYKKDNTGLKNENEAKLISRHEIKCTIEDIASVSSKLLKNGGELYMVHRPERLAEIIQVLVKYKLEPKILKLVYPKKDKEPNLILIKAVKNAKSFLKIEKPLFVYDENNKYTQDILEIYNKGEFNETENYI